MHNTRRQVIVYHHTHWDREWWSTFQDFRYRLVQVIDRLLAVLEADPDFRCFVLDGQMAVLRDYLEVRPEARERLTGFIRAGRIHVGPWYVLPDEFLVSGESLVRNLLLGRRVAAELAVPLTGIGYLPDSFGHIAQMPQILRGVGCDAAVVWRGFGALPHNEFTWEGPDGSRVLGLYLAREYYLGFWPAAASDAADFVRRFAAQMASRSRTPYILEPYGGDHLTVDPRLPDLVRQVDDLLGAAAAPGQADLTVRHGSLAEFVDLVRESAPTDLTVWQGEARSFGHDLTYLLPGVYSARLPLKQANARAQTWLERYAEPLQGLGGALGGGHESRLLWLAWENLLQNHPHDSICGCSIDPVHRQMGPRFEAAQEIAELLAYEALAHLGSRVAAGSPDLGPETLLVFNPLPAARTDTVRALLPRFGRVSPQTHALIGPDGAAVPYQSRNVVEQRLRESFGEWTEVRFTATAVPGVGYACYRFVPAEPEAIRTPMGQDRRRPLPFGLIGPAAQSKGHESPTDLRVGPLAMLNGYLEVTINPADGALTVRDRETGLRYSGLNRFEDGGDAGDEYNYSAPVADRVYTTEGLTPVITLVEPGPARATFCIEYDWRLPAALTEDRYNRSPALAPFRLRTFVTLPAGVRRLEIRTEWENQSADHRLRVRLPLGVPTRHSEAETAFGVVRRPVGPVTGSGTIEPQVQTNPQQSFVSVSGDGRGLTVLNRGLPEYEALPDAAGTVCLTLLRCVGWLGRGDLVARYGGAGPKLPTPDAQQPGPGAAEYALVFHAGTWLAAGAATEAQAYAAPLLGRTLQPTWALSTPFPPAAAAAPDRAQPLPLQAALLQVDGPPHVVLSALKRSEAGDRLVVRLVNLGTEPAAVTVRSPLVIKSAQRVSLAEEPLPDGALPVADGVPCRLAPHQIVSLALATEEAV